MNYEIENNYDWKKDLLNDDQMVNESICLISNLRLSDGFVTLPCKHSFNYFFILQDVIKQKKNNYLDSIRLKYNQIKCPYCRQVYDNVLPYYKLENSKKIYGVNSPEHISFKFHECKYCYTSGNKKGMLCSKNAMFTESGPYCNQHIKLKNKNELDPLLKLKVIELKEKLRKNGCKVGGKKSVLIERIKVEKINKNGNWIE